MKRKFIKCQSGEAYVDLAITFLIIIAFITSIMLITPILTTKFSLNQSAKHLTRTIEINGKADQTTIDDAFADDKLLYPDEIVIDTVYENASRKTIQLKIPFTVIVSKRVGIPIIKPLFSDTVYIYINVKTNLKGISEVYYKP